MIPGYTKLQAQRIMDALDRDMAKVESIVAGMGERVTDHGEWFGPASLEDLRFRVTQLKDTVRRRTRT